MVTYPKSCRLITTRELKSIHCDLKNNTGLACCNFDEHRMILIIFWQQCSQLMILSLLPFLGGIKFLIQLMRAHGARNTVQLMLLRCAKFSTSFLLVLSYIPNRPELNSFDYNFQGVYSSVNISCKSTKLKKNQAATG